MRGECDIATVHVIEDELRPAGSEPIEVDLSEVTFIDAAGLGAFLRVRKRNPNMRVVNPSNAVLRVLEITATAHLLDHGAPRTIDLRDRQ